MTAQDVTAALVWILALALVAVLGRTPVLPAGMRWALLALAAGTAAVLHRVVRP